MERAQQEAIKAAKRQARIDAGKKPNGPFASAEAPIGTHYNVSYESDGETKVIEIEAPTPRAAFLEFRKDHPGVRVTTVLASRTK